VDVHDTQTRSFNMSHISGRDTKPELIVRKVCHRLGLRFRLHSKDLPGKPDLVFARHRTVILVNGCYWHSHDCRFGAVQPKTNSAFWRDKRAATMTRDLRNCTLLEELGWRVLVYWECELKAADALVSRVIKDFSL